MNKFFLSQQRVNILLLSVCLYMTAIRLTAMLVHDSRRMTVRVGKPKKTNNDFLVIISFTCYIFKQDSINGLYNIKYLHFARTVIDDAIVVSCNAE